MWQNFYERHRSENFEIFSIAVDVQGAKVVRRYVEKFGVTFPVVVDTTDVFGRAFGLTIIPETMLVDEVGIIRLRGHGPDPKLLAEIETMLKEPASTVRGELPQLPAARSRAELEAAIAGSPGDWQSRVALAQHLADGGELPEAISQIEIAAKLQPGDAGVAFTWGQLLLRQGQQTAALAKLKRARDLAPDNWRIRKQIWAIEHPDKFYTSDSPDYDWQKEELEREKQSAER